MAQAMLNANERRKKSQCSGTSQQALAFLMGTSGCLLNMYKHSMYLPLDMDAAV